MRPSVVAKALNYLIDARQPVMLHGQPGAGKSQVVAQVAAGRGVELMDVRLSQLDPVDLRGVPSIRDGKTCWNPPDFLPTDGEGILFLDEINSAAQATQAASYQLILDRKLGDYVLPVGWAMVAAGNRTQDRAIVNQMSTALRNRMVHIDFDVHVQDWETWALKKYINPEILGFIRWRPSLLNEFDAFSKEDATSKKKAQALKDAKAFATPRSWEFMDKLVKQQPDVDTEFDLYCGTVGEGPATEFMAYMKIYRNLPALDAILADPKKIKVPTDPAVLCALCTGLAMKATQKNFEAIIDFALRMEPEFQVLLVKDAVTRDYSFTNHKSFDKWAVKNTNVLL